MTASGRTQALQGLATRARGLTETSSKEPSSKRESAATPKVDTAAAATQAVPRDDAADAVRPSAQLFVGWDHPAAPAAGTALFSSWAEPSWAGEGSLPAELLRWKRVAQAKRTEPPADVAPAVAPAVASAAAAAPAAVTLTAAFAPAEHDLSYTRLVQENRRLRRSLGTLESAHLDPRRQRIRQGQRSQRRIRRALRSPSQRRWRL